MLRSLLSLSLLLGLLAAAVAQEPPPPPRPMDDVPPPVISPYVPAPFPTPAPVEAMPIPTHRQVAEALQPLPGKYRVVMIHPCTCRPVEVCFELPDRCAKFVRATSNEIEIRYGLCKFVKIRFYKNGDVRVRTGCLT